MGVQNLSADENSPHSANHKAGEDCSNTTYNYLGLGKGGGEYP